MNLKTYCKASCFFLLILCTKISAEVDFVIRKVATQQKIVAITIDDGPSMKYTPQILEVLAEKKTKATFFLIAKNVEKFPELALSITDNNHSLGNHGYEHIYIKDYSSKELLKSIAKSQLVFYNSVGFLPKYFRPPFGKFTDNQLEIFNYHFKHIVRWSIDPRDWDKNKSNRSIIKHVKKELKPGYIIVLHENERLHKVLPKLIKEITKKGYKCVSLDELIEASN
tara:strand:- start:582 stop:1256 length:675 start_codon:yes stop_codon:yes gene_type:complete